MAVWERLPWFGRLVPLFRLPVMMGLAKAGYRLFLRLRPWLTGRRSDDRTETCG